MIFPSKELLSEVLGYEVTNTSHNGLNDGEIDDRFAIHINPSQRADRPSSCIIPKYTINIYALAHKCKEWAFNNGYLSQSTFVNNFVKNVKSSCRLLSTSDLENYRDFYADREPEAIFIACQWIFDNKKETKNL